MKTYPFLRYCQMIAERFVGNLVFFLPRVLIEKMMATTWLGDNDMSVSGHGDYINLKDGSTSNWGCC